MASLIAVVTLLAVIASINGQGTNGTAFAERVGWCDYAERFVGTLVREDRFDLYCSGVAEIEVIAGRLSPRYQGDYVDATFRFLNTNGVGVYDVAYVTWSPFGTSRECSPEGIRRAYSGRISMSCQIGELEAGTQHVFTVRAGSAVANVTIVVPDPFPTRREYEDAELARRPAVEVVSATLTGRFADVRLTLRNNSQKTVTAVDVLGSAYDGFDRKVGAECGRDITRWTLSRSSILPRGNTHTYTLDTSCWRGAVRVSFWIRLVQFSDGTRWSP